MPFILFLFLEDYWDDSNKCFLHMFFQAEIIVQTLSRYHLLCLPEYFLWLFDSIQYMFFNVSFTMHAFLLFNFKISSIRLFFQFMVINDGSSLFFFSITVSISQFPNVFLVSISSVFLLYFFQVFFLFSFTRFLDSFSSNSYGQVNRFYSYETYIYIVI